jgi:hypothetical protein
MESMHRQGQTEDFVISALPSCACRYDVAVRHRDGYDRALTFQIQFVCSEKRNWEECSKLYCYDMF